MRPFSVFLASKSMRMGIALLLGAGSACGYAAVEHPMDPLAASEVLAAANILLDAGAAAPDVSFQSIDLREPPKDYVLTFEPGDAILRSATVFFRQNKQSFRTVVDLTESSFTPPVEILASDGQLGLTFQELVDFSFVFQHPDIRAALATRGIDARKERDDILVMPYTSGAFGLPEDTHRIVKAQMYNTQGAGINLVARPFEGIQAIIDLDDKRVIDVIDTGVVPMPLSIHDFDEATIDARYGLRPPLKPIRISQPEGRNFSLDGHVIEWQKWRFHLRFERRSGPVISLVSYDGRSVLYQGALSEIFVPYQDPDQNWFYRMFVDGGEFGFGALVSPLKLGLDVPENAMLLDGLISAALSDPKRPVIPLPLDNVIGVFERATGSPLWRHYEFLSDGLYEGRAEVELVVRSIAQMANYDYVIDWVFTQSGAIRVDIGLTGIDTVKAVASTNIDDPGGRNDIAHGALVAPQLVAPYHSHYFNFRLDLDVDGRNNSFVLGGLRLQSNQPGSPRKGVWVLEEQALETEEDARLHGDGIWRVINPGKINVQGYNTSYILESHAHGHISPLMHGADFRRARFIGHDPWVTAFSPDERFASGDTPNQNPGEPGLPQYIANDERIVNTDIVLWHTVAFHHITAAEDFPVLSRERGSFELKPANFFDRNPAIDLRRAPFEVGP